MKRKRNGRSVLNRGETGEIEAERKKRHPREEEHAGELRYLALLAPEDHRTVHVVDRHWLWRRG